MNRRRGVLAIVALVGMLVLGACKDQVVRDYLEHDLVPYLDKLSGAVCNLDLHVNPVDTPPFTQLCPGDGDFVPPPRFPPP